jgi:hypothetical protein
VNQRARKLLVPASLPWGWQCLLFRTVLAGLPRISGKLYVSLVIEAAEERISEE